MTRWWLQGRGKRGQFQSRRQMLQEQIQQQDDAYTDYALELALELLNRLEATHSAWKNGWMVYDVTAELQMRITGRYKALRDWCIRRGYVDRCPTCDGKLHINQAERCAVCEGKGYLPSACIHDWVHVDEAGKTVCGLCGVTYPVTFPGVKDVRRG